MGEGRGPETQALVFMTFIPSLTQPVITTLLPAQSLFAFNGARWTGA